MKTTAEKKHTPTPWGINGTHKLFDEQDEDSLIIRADGMWVAVVTPDANDHVRLGKEEVQANAEFIVRAVNSHEELLESLKACVAMMDYEDADPAEQFKHSNWTGYKAAVAAISKAETTL